MGARGLAERLPVALVGALLAAGLARADAALEVPTLTRGERRAQAGEMDTGGRDGQRRERWTEAGDEMRRGMRRGEVRDGQM